MRGLYTSGIYLFRFGIFLAGLFNAKARRWQAGRKNLFAELEKTFSGKNEKTVWFHCASLGEFEQGRPLMDAFRKREPGTRILLTFFSPSGYEIRKNYAGADYIFYLPLDTPGNARRFIAQVKPSAAFFVKYEFWYNFLAEMRANKIPHYLVSGIFRPTQPFFKSYGGWFRKALRGYTHIFTQEESSLQLLHTAGIENASVSGDTRYDRVIEIAAGAKEIPVAAAFKNGQPLFIAGSTWPADEDILVPFIRSQREKKGPMQKFILVPHEIGEAHIGRLVRLLSDNGIRDVIRFSQTEAAAAGDSSVLIIDNIGMLSSLYRYAEAGYIGGGFGAGIHNTLEAAVYGMPLFFGPNYEKFHEAKGLIACGAAFSIRSAEEFERRFLAAAADSSTREALAAKARQFVKANGGATEKILSLLRS